MLSVAEAQETRTRRPSILSTPSGCWWRMRLGLTLAEDLRAPHPLPRFDNSAMDGYAVRAGDTAGASEGTPVDLRVTGEVRAGCAFSSR